jgi:hypothetical protein
VNLATSRNIKMIQLFDAKSRHVDLKCKLGTRELADWDSLAQHKPLFRVTKPLSEVALRDPEEGKKADCVMPSRSREAAAQLPRMTRVVYIYHGLGPLVWWGRNHRATRVS